MTNALEKIRQRLELTNQPMMITKNFDGSHWLIAQFGADEDGKNVDVTTDHVHASEFRGGATEAAEFFINAHKDIEGLLAVAEAAFKMCQRCSIHRGPDLSRCEACGLADAINKLTEAEG